LLPKPQNPIILSLNFETKKIIDYKVTLLLKLGYPLASIKN